MMRILATFSFVTTFVVGLIVCGDNDCAHAAKEKTIQVKDIEIYAESSRVPNSTGVIVWHPQSQLDVWNAMEPSVLARHFVNAALDLGFDPVTYAIEFQDAGAKIDLELVKKYERMAAKSPKNLKNTVSRDIRTVVGLWNKLEPEVAAQVFVLLCHRLEINPVSYAKSLAHVPINLDLDLVTAATSAAIRTRPDDVAPVMKDWQVKSLNIDLPKPDPVGIQSWVLIAGGSLTLLLFTSVSAFLSYRSVKKRAQVKQVKLQNVTVQQPSSARQPNVRRE